MSATFEYAVIKNGAVESVMRLQRRPAASEVKVVDGKPTLLPIEDAGRPNVDGELYDIAGPRYEVKSESVARVYDVVLRRDVRDVLLRKVNDAAQVARGNRVGDKLIGSAGVVMLMKALAGMRYLESGASDALLTAGLDSVASDAKSVAREYVREYEEVSAVVAAVESAASRVAAAIAAAKDDAAAVAAWDSRPQELKQ